MKPLFIPQTVFTAVEGSRFASQDDAVRASLIHLLWGGVKDEYPIEPQVRELFDRVYEFDLLNAMHDQMIKLGYVPGATTSYVYFDQAEVAKEDSFITLEEAYKSLQIICGAKAYEWLRDLDGSAQNATDVRARVLADYAHNAHEDVDHLSTVLTFIAESIKSEPIHVAPADPLFGKPFPQLSLEGFVDMANKNGQDIGRESLESLLGRTIFPNSILTKPNLYFLLDHFGLTYDHTKGYEFDFTFGKGLKTTFPLTQLADELHVKPLDIIEAGKTFGYDLRPESEITDYEANAIRAYAQRNWRD